MDFYNNLPISVVQNPKYTPKTSLSLATSGTNAALRLPSVQLQSPAHQTLIDKEGKFQKKVIADYEQAKKDYDDFMALKQSVVHRIEQVRLNAVAPGLGSKPPLIPARPSRQSSSLNNDEAVSSGGRNGGIDYLEFEHGLPPDNPWDTPVDDMEQLKSVFPTAASKPSPLTSKSSASSLNSEQPMTTKSKLFAKISSVGDRLSSPLSSLPASLSAPLSKISSTISSKSSPSSSSEGRFLSKPPPTYSSSQNSKYSRLNSSFAEVVSMGFESDIMDAGIRLYPTEGDKVMNFCLAVLNYEKQGHERQAAFDAIELYGKTDPEDGKVGAYLEAFSRVKELGFTSNQVRQSLISTEPKDVASFKKWSEQAAAKLLN